MEALLAPAVLVSITAGIALFIMARANGWSPLEAVRAEDGVVNTGYVVMSGIVAVIAIAIGVIMFGRLSDSATQIDLDYNQISN